MPTCIFILSRFTLRVDNVLFRAHDTRIYHSFASAPPLVVREMRGWEAPFERVKRVRSDCSSPRLWFISPPFLGPATAGRLDAAYRRELYLQSTFGYAEGDVARGRRRHWLARSRNCRPGHHAIAVIGETSILRLLIWSPAVFVLGLAEKSILRAESAAFVHLASASSLAYNQAFLAHTCQPTCHARHLDNIGCRQRHRLFTCTHSAQIVQ